MHRGWGPNLAHANVFGVASERSKIGDSSKGRDFCLHAKEQISQGHYIFGPSQAQKRSEHKRVDAGILSPRPFVRFLHSESKVEEKERNEMDPKAPVFTPESMDDTKTGMITNHELMELNDLCASLRTLRWKSYKEIDVLLKSLEPENEVVDESLDDTKTGKITYHEFRQWSHEEREKEEKYDGFVYENFNEEEDDDEEEEDEDDYSRCNAGKEELDEESRQELIDEQLRFLISEGGPVADALRARYPHAAALLVPD